MFQDFLIVSKEDENERVDKFLATRFPDFTRSFIQKAIKNGQIKLNGKDFKSNYKLKLDDKIEINIEDPIELEIEPEDIPLDILYEDDDVLIVNKPKNMVVHPSAGHFSHTLVNAIMFHCKDSLSGINGIIRPGIVHRIDMNTTGSLIICKNDVSHTKIAEQIKEHSVNRIYVGLVYGRLANDEGTVEGPIGRNPSDRKKMAINYKNGKPAITHYKVLERFNEYTFVKFKLETGRTHQIRVHMASIGHPLVGDDIYSNNKKCKFKHLEGQCLHARTIGFIHPTLNQYVEFQAPIPEYLDKLLNTLRINEHKDI
ncbi:RluA family pseudouridine synthase [Lachnobacterium bovis]|uniref:Pseudouridine synthase n=1 Tax=Lachnobacterium bovis DSM 14045 TaxID=1122142 RepID=A0A1H3F842_9FIRM|nr:RluA family pseudouridine synthase [Lachnobacterium bovis]MBQ1802940.1 RluA family pseudouridine synthase [Lachnobacterium sp.]SDX86364.1 23S rRNA pseudouridine1911/1915/1917 synthase [Lachnobacterium bovis DSM 14045]